MSHYLLTDCNILQKQRCPSVAFIKEKFCSKFLYDRSALNILESCNYLWYEPVLELLRSGKTFTLTSELKPDQKNFKFDLSFSCKLLEKRTWKYQWLNSDTTVRVYKSENAYS